MREDMFKVIVERPRWGSRWRKNTKIRHDKLPDRSRVTGRRLAIETGGRKWLNENLAPLKRYLHKQIGRKWDDVFSEICQHLDTGSTVKMHVREHLDDFVCRKVRVDNDGRFWAAGRWGEEVLLEETWSELYVDPTDGCLKLTRDFCAKQGVSTRRDAFRQRNRKGPDASEFIRHIEALKWHMKLKGIWYLVELSTLPKSVYGYEEGLISLHQDVSSEAWRFHVRWAVTDKVQLSKKSLKAKGLKNDPSFEEVI